MNTTVNRNTSSTGELLRTYKVGLRCPESLLMEFRDLIRRQQVLRFLQRLHSKGFTPKQLKTFEELAHHYKDPKILACEQFKRYNSLQRANERVITQYENTFDDYFSCSATQLLAEIERINARLLSIKLRRGNYMLVDSQRVQFPLLRTLPTRSRQRSLYMIISY